jgi:hypothetical protein
MVFYMQYILNSTTFNISFYITNTHIEKDKDDDDYDNK